MRYRRWGRATPAVIFHNNVSIGVAKIYPDGMVLIEFDGKFIDEKIYAMFLTGLANSFTIILDTKLGRDHAAKR